LSAAAHYICFPFSVHIGLKRLETASIFLNRKDYATLKRHLTPAQVHSSPKLIAALEYHTMLVFTNRRT